MEEQLVVERKKVRKAQGTTYSIRGNLDTVQSLLDTLQSVFCKMADEENFLTIQMKPKLKRKMTQGQLTDDYNYNSDDNRVPIKKARTQ